MATSPPRRTHPETLDESWERVKPDHDPPPELIERTAARILAHRERVAQAKARKP